MDQHIAFDYAVQLRQLLPQGFAWDFTADSNLAALIGGLAEEFARIDGRSAVLIEEADPRTTLELLSDWERVAGLPDACFGQPDNIAERQVALAQKVSGIGGQDIAFYTELAARLGYVVQIAEHRSARIGMRCDEPLNGADWDFAWTVMVQSFEGDIPSEQSLVAVAKIGDRIGVRLRGFGAIDLECIIRRHAPAHTQVIFAYETEPDALFWMNFNE
ncbi:YmfQ family protein [Sphingorhabdus sp. 109]|uniref:YmfQ family protein n=1 Tax=Sphingorhabdus sp. 109 TaxID=2653173 RepID=UPI0012F064F7|nr:putative phage tail protein [Sphingorhabdus sp. 109]VWX62614.1 conserved hypothetical protein [Sphingorhabdus sp. 109]